MLAAERILRALTEHDVEFVLIGALAATVRGSTLRTEDVDVCPRRSESNLRNLATALDALDAKEYDPHKGELIERAWDAPTLASDRTWLLGTSAGRLDLVFEPAGTGGYEDLAKDADVVEIDDLRVRVASLKDVIRSKEATNRPRDREQLPTLRRLLDVSEGE
ncbi:MAG TPA: hypothetical protein VHI71_02965 [Actinomycetota bacterium]|nr:hypothetical protein [Actinomycetota bacterium]